MMRMLIEGADGVFERVADGVAHDGRLVRFRAFAAEVAFFDVFLRVVQWRRRCWRSGCRASRR